MPIDQQTRSRSRSPIRTIIAFVIALLLLFVIFSGSRQARQTAEVPSAAAKRSMDIIKQHKNSAPAPRQ